MVSQALKLAAKLSRKGAHHLQHMELLASLPDLSNPQEEYDFAIISLEDHKKTCSGCSGRRLAQLTTSPEEVKALLEDFKRRTKYEEAKK